MQEVPIGQVTSNISIFIPADGETLYGQSFAAGMLNIDQHDHSGPPTKGVPLSSTGLADYSVTNMKLNNTQPTSVVYNGGGIILDPTTNQLKADGLLLSLYQVATIGLLVQTGTGGSEGATSRAITGTPNQIGVANGNGASGNPAISILPAYTNTIPSSTNIVVIDNIMTTSYVPNANLIYAIIEVVGGAGGGGGVVATSGTSDVAAAGGGGSGGYSRGIFTAAQLGASIAVSVGAGGTAGAAGNNVGGNGGTTSVGSTLIQATGGTGGSGSTHNVSINNAGGTAGVGSLGSLNLMGNNGGNGFGTNPNSGNVRIAQGGMGASSFFGGSPLTASTDGNAVFQVTGNDGTAYGAGGGGAVSSAGTSAAGGAGASGAIIITEFIHS